MAAFELDCKGQMCPKPIISISKRMASLASGDTLRIEATDPAFRADVTAWVELRGQLLRELDISADVSVALLEKR